MTPPDGAWMTRDGDVIEIGCHSGSKTWMLECKGSEWVGTIGLCGSGLMVAIHNYAQLNVLLQFIEAGSNTDEKYSSDQTNFQENPQPKKKILHISTSKFTAASITMRAFFQPDITFRG